MPKQPELPGAERTAIPEIDDAAAAYVSVRDKRMALTEKEITAKANLITVVIAHAKELAADGDGNRCYRFDDQLVILKPGKPNVRVRHEAEDDDEDED